MTNEDMISQLQEHPKVQQMKSYVQHGTVTTYEHCCQVTRLSVAINDRFHLHADNMKLTRAAMLHDFYLYDWHNDDDGTHKWHGFHHADRAVENAERYFDISKKEKEIIYSHMWPLNITRVPRSREAWIVCMADKICSLHETLFRRKKKIH